MLQVLIHRCLLLAVTGVGLITVEARSEEVRIAVAANFLEPLRALQPVFEESYSHRMLITSGSTGLLFAQIRNGAPFDVLLAADSERPQKLAAEGFGDESQVFTYANGRLALWSAVAGRIDDSTLAALDSEQFRWLAIAEPATAPYGAAARQVLERLGVWESLQQRLVKGHSVAQTFAMIETGNAELGIIALSQALAYDGESSYIAISQALHEPIRQDAMVLNRGIDNPAAREFATFLLSPVATAIIEKRGYIVPRQQL